MTNKIKIYTGIGIATRDGGSTLGIGYTPCLTSPVIADTPQEFAAFKLKLEQHVEKELPSSEGWEHEPVNISIHSFDVACNRCENLQLFSGKKQ